MKDNFDSLEVKNANENKIELNLELDNLDRNSIYRVKSNIELSYNNSASGHVSINLSVEKENNEKKNNKENVDNKDNRHNKDNSKNSNNYEINIAEVYKKNKDNNINCKDHIKLPFLDENTNDINNQETNRPILTNTEVNGGVNEGANGNEHCDSNNSNTKDNKENVEKQEDATPDNPEYKLRMCNLFFLMVNISIGYFMIGYEVGVFNQIQENVNTDLGWDAEEKKLYLAIISVMVPVGAVFGSVIMGKSAHNIGRKNAYIIWDCIIIVGIAITMIANTYSMIIGRLICGFGVGGFVVLVPMLMKEFVPDKYEGYGAAMYAICFNIGLLTSFALGINIPDITKPDFVWWRIMYAFPSILILTNIILLLTKYTQETPIYLLTIDNREACIESYKQIYEEEEDILKVIVDLEHHLKKKKEAEEITYGILCGPRFSKQLFIGFILNIAYMSPATNIFNS